MPAKRETLLNEGLRLGFAPILAAGLFSLVSNLLYLAMPVYTNIIYGRVLLSQSTDTLLVMTGAVIFVFLISTVLDMIRQQVLINFGIIFDRFVSGRVFAALFEGVVQRRMPARAQALRDLDTFRAVLSGQTVATAFDIPWSPIFIFALFLISPVLGAIGLGGSLILVLLAWLQSRATRGPRRTGLDQAIDSYTFTDQALRNSEVIRALGMVDALGAIWSERRDRSVARTSEAGERQELFSNAIRMVRMVVQILIIAAGAWLIIEQKTPSGMLFASMIISGRAMQPIDRLVASWRQLVEGRAAFDRLQAVVADYVPPPISTELPRPTGALTVDALTYAVPGAPRLLLSGVTFRLEAGETLGVIGASGSGKSTLARMLMGVWKPAAGHVRLDGAEVFTWDRAQFGRHVGYLPQDVELFAGTVRDNIARFRPEATDAEVIAAAQLANAHELILGLSKGYETELGEGGAVLSAGQRQRVGLARALFGDPAFLVLDEPNAALDSAGEEALMGAMIALKQKGVTVVVVSHKANAFRTADKILMLRDGRMEMFGPRDQVFEQLAKANQKGRPAAPPPAPAALPQTAVNG